MSIGSITHEFFHQLDRAVERDAAAPFIPAGTSLRQYLDQNFTAQTGVPYNAESIYDVGEYETQAGLPVVQIVVGYVGQVAAVGSSAELLADIGMTAVLSGSGQRVLVRMPDGIFQDFEVDWASTQNADDVRIYIDRLMGELFGS